MPTRRRGTLSTRGEGVPKMESLGSLAPRFGLSRLEEGTIQSSQFKRSFVARRVQERVGSALAQDVRQAAAGAE